MRPRPRSGPVVWAGILAGTCLLLFLAQKVLWLVVPFLLALILYYFLFAPMQWLMYRGLSRSAAAAAVMLGFLVVAGAYLALLLPWIAAQLGDWQDSVLRYLHGGQAFLQQSLRGLERAYGVLAGARIADLADQRIAGLTDHASQYVEPLLTGLLAWAPALLLTPFVAFFLLRDGGHFQHMLGRAVPNAFFEKTLYLLNEVDRTTRAYFQGLLRLTFLDTLTLALGLWLLGLPAPVTLGLVCAVLSWLPFIGSILGGLLVVLVAATDFPQSPQMAYAAVALFLLVRMLDDFVYLPLTVGRSLHMHPLITVLMIFIGGAIAGIAGLMLVMPLLGVVRVVGETLGAVIADARLMARFRHGRALGRLMASADLRS